MQQHDAEQEGEQRREEGERGQLRRGVVPQHPHPGEVAREGADGRLQRDRHPGIAGVVQRPALAERQRQQRRDHGRDRHLVEQRVLRARRRHLRAADHEGRQAPQRAAGQRQRVAAQLARGAVAGEALAEGQRHGGEGDHQADPLRGPQPFRRHEAGQQQRHHEGRGVEEHRQARGRGVAQPEVDAGELAGEQRPGQQAGGQGAVAVEQPHAAPGAPDPEQHRRAGEAQRGLPQRRHLAHGGLDQDLLQAPEQAAGQQQRNRQRVEMFFAVHHAPMVAGPPGPFSARPASPAASSAPPAPRRPGCAASPIRGCAPSPAAAAPAACRRAWP